MLFLSECKNASFLGIMLNLTQEKHHTANILPAKLTRPIFFSFSDEYIIHFY